MGKIAEMTPEERRIYNNRASRKHDAKVKDELPAALGYLWGVGAIGERCKTAQELLQSAREYALFLKTMLHPETRIESRPGETIRQYVELVEGAWRAQGRPVMDRVSHRALDAVPAYEESTIDYNVPGVDKLVPKEFYIDSIHAADYPRFLTYMSLIDADDQDADYPAALYQSDAA